MSADDQIEELKRIIEEEREAKRQYERTRWAGLSEEQKQRRLQAQHKYYHEGAGKEKGHEKYLRRKQTDGYEKDKAYQREYKRMPLNRKRSVALTKARIERKQEAEAGRPRPQFCEVCNSPDRIMFDHCHDSNKFRGWLCAKCNSVLGYVNNDPVRLEKLAVYLRTHNA